MRVYCRCPDAGLLRQFPFEKIFRQEIWEGGVQAEAELAADNLAPVIEALRKCGGFLARMPNPLIPVQIQSSVSRVSVPV
ncbi:MAG: hypothetical protein IPM36_04055 [Lewinellaceae bacterium]|nr:hypothetical protein [Lewinellaceae bacterium]